MRKYILSAMAALMGAAIVLAQTYPEHAPATVEAASGTSAVSTVTASEDVGDINVTTLTIAALQITNVTYLGGATNALGGHPIYTFPQGVLKILGATMTDLTMGTNFYIDAADGGDFAVGTATATGTDGAISTTEVNIIPSTSTDTLTNVTDSASTAEAMVNGATTAVQLFLNTVTDNGDITAAGTYTNNVASGTLKVHWINLGDY